MGGGEKVAEENERKRVEGGEDMFRVWDGRRREQKQNAGWIYNEAQEMREERGDKMRGETTYHPHFVLAMNKRLRVNKTFA